MKATRVWQTPGVQKSALKSRFKIVPFLNPIGGTQSWRVSGVKRDGTRVRENFSDADAARCRQNELQTEWLGSLTDTSIRATKLSETGLRLAEVAIARLGNEQELLRAVDYWITKGRAEGTPTDSPRLDEAVAEFVKWLEGTATLRDRTKGNLRHRVTLFANGSPNLAMSEITPEVIEGFLGAQKISPVSRDNYKRALSRFFSWTSERPRRWISVNPCSLVRVERGELPPPAILTLDECQRLLSAAEAYKGGQLVPYLVASLFGGLRPTEAARLSWPQVNLADGEIRLEGVQTKTGRPRVIPIGETLKAWLLAYGGKPFAPHNWRRDFDEIKRKAGFGGRGDKGDKRGALKAWPADVLRHTAVTHFFRQCGSYGQTAEWAGNSEAIIKAHYQGRVSSEETKQFYAMLPVKGRKATDTNGGKL